MEASKVIANWPKSLDANGLSSPQKEGVSVLIDAWDELGDGDNRKLAYLLATVWHETAKTMQPIEEFGKGSKKLYGKPDMMTGQCYFGRGHVQLTWRENYEKFGKIINADLVNHPEYMLDPVISADVSVIGMVRGSFTGKKLGDYFTKTKADYVNARRIINGTDKAQLIADYAKAIHSNITV